MRDEAQRYWLHVDKEALLKIGVDEDSIFEDIASPEYESLTQADLTYQQCEKLIPEGSYCYGSHNGVLTPCPFHDMIPNFPKQENGYCHYLKGGDFQGGSLGLLWDSCKECGVKEYTQDYDHAL